MAGLSRDCEFKPEGDGTGRPAEFPMKGCWGVGWPGGTSQQRASRRSGVIGLHQEWKVGVEAIGREIGAGGLLEG